jgi:Zn-dependent protease
MNLKNIGFILIQLSAALIGAVLHEIAHGYSALKLGDTTARDAGRLTLNPLKHIDLFSTVLLPAAMVFMHLPPLIMFKPVPINMNNLHNPRRDSRIVALAGPLTNFAIVILTALIYQLFLTGVQSTPLILFIYSLIIINLFLGAFNLIPIPPLDGSWVLQSFLPEQALVGYAKIRTWFVVIFLILIFTGLFNFLFSPVVRFLDATAKVLMTPGLLSQIFYR